jgi:hypothetical protein
MARAATSLTAGLQRAASAAALAAADPSEADPVFEFIEQHASDQQDFATFLAENSEPERSKCEERAWCETVQASLHELIETPPTTLVGVIALLAHIQDSNGHEVMSQDEWLELMRSLVSGLQEIAEITVSYPII